MLCEDAVPGARHPDHHRHDRAHSGSALRGTDGARVGRARPRRSQERAADRYRPCAEERAGQGRVRRELPHPQADGHEPGERAAVARRPESWRQRRFLERLVRVRETFTCSAAGRATTRVPPPCRRTSHLCAPDYPGQQSLGEDAGGHRRDRADIRPNHQSQRHQSAAQRDGQPNPVLPGELGG